MAILTACVPDSPESEGRAATPAFDGADAGGGQLPVSDSPSTTTPAGDSPAAADELADATPTSGPAPSLRPLASVTGSETPGPVGPAGAGLTVVADALGDVQGASVGDGLVDLREVSVQVHDATVRIRYRLAGTPVGARGPSVLNLLTAFDVDTDGAADHEVWATLTDSGWEGSRLERGPGGQMSVQPSSSVTVTPTTEYVDVSVPAVSLGDPASFGFVSAAEDGLVADYRDGTTATDAAPGGPRVAEWPEQSM